MKPNRNPNEPISNLEIGTVIEVDGTHIVAELDPKITELTLSRFSGKWTTVRLIK